MQTFLFIIITKLLFDSFKFAFSMKSITKRLLSGEGRITDIKNSDIIWKNFQYALFLL